MRIVALDPGLTTGWAEWHGGTFPSSEHPDPLGLLMELDNLVHRLDEVVCENFVPRPGVRSWQPDALHIIGAVRYFCHRERVPLHLPMPSSKTFATDARLKKAGMYVPANGHANDAARHLLRRLVRLGEIALEDIL